MMKIKFTPYIILLLLSLFSCNTQEARYPISHTSGEFLKESIERNKKLVNTEENSFKEIFEKDTITTYHTSTKGYWYKYDVKVNDSTAYPIKGDIVEYEYEVSDIDGNIIYSIEDNKLQRYLVDKENIMTGLRYGIKQMKQGETVTFYFPSHIAYGYHGDKNDIGTNIPIICKVNLNKISKSN